MDGGLYQSGISTPPLFNKHGNHNRADKLLPLTISQTPELWSNMTVISRVKTAHLRLTIIVIIPYIFLLYNGNKEIVLSYGKSADEGDNPFDNPNIQPPTPGSSLKIRF